MGGYSYLKKGPGKFGAGGNYLGLIMGSCFPKSFSVVTVTGYGSDTVNKAGGKMTRLLF